MGGLENDVIVVLRGIHIALALHISYCTGGDMFFHSLFSEAC